MTFLQRISNLFFQIKNDKSEKEPPTNTVIPDLCLEKYENRSPEIKNSNEPIEGIFFIYNNQIIPDYYTECLESESVCMNCYRSPSDIRRQMYLITFYENYMANKFPELKRTWNEKALPRGRTGVHFSTKVLYLDECYADNAEILNQIYKLYRLPCNTMIIPHYTCSKCFNLKDLQK